MVGSQSHPWREVRPRSHRTGGLADGTRKVPGTITHAPHGEWQRGVGKFGRSRWTHNPEITGSNPVSATSRGSALAIRSSAVGSAPRS